MLHTLDTVHLRHEMIHQYDVVSFHKRHGKCFFTTGCGVDGDLCSFEKFGLDKKVHRTVVNDEYPCLGCGKRCLICFLRSFLIISGDLDVSDRIGSRDFLPERDRKCGPLRIYAVHGDPSAHHINKLLYYRKAQSGTFDAGIFTFVKPLECIEQIRYDLLFDTHSGIGYGEHQHDLVFIKGFLFDIKCHRTFLRILDGIVQKIYEYLLDTYLITVQFGRNGRIDLNI